MNVAAILYEGDEGSAIDTLLTSVSYCLRQAGWKLAGAVQSPVAVRNTRCEMTLEDLATGACIEMADRLGPSASGCRLDTEALEDSVGLAASALDPDTNLVIINRFGKRETEGHGFRSMIENAVALDVPVLVGLKKIHLDAWTQFVGGEPLLLPTDVNEILSWCEVTASSASSSAAAERSVRCETQG
jgi:nucleoside-triphosphatase THEP1